MARKKSIEEEINEFLEAWGQQQQTEFLTDIIPILELYNVDDQDDWVASAVGGDAENIRTVRLIRSVYLLSKLCAFHASKICSMNFHFRDLWKRMEKHGMGQGESLIRQGDAKDANLCALQAGSTTKGC